MPVDPPPGGPGLAFHVAGSRLSTLGLVAMAHPELSVAIAGSTELPAARALLTALAAEIVRRGRPLSPGERLEWGESFLQVRVALLELFELDVASGRWVRGAPHLLVQLATEGE
jgi:hypothetical protein